MIVENGLGKDRGDEISSEADHIVNVERALAGNVKMRRRLKRTHPSVCSTREEAAIDCLFELLGHEVLPSRSSALTEERIILKKHYMVVMRCKI